MRIESDLNTERRITKRYKTKEGKEVYVMTLRRPKFVHDTRKVGPTYKVKYDDFGDMELEEVKPAPRPVQRGEVVRVTYGDKGEPLIENV